MRLHVKAREISNNLSKSMAGIFTKTSDKKPERDDHAKNEDEEPAGGMDSQGENDARKSYSGWFGKDSRLRPKRATPVAPKFALGGNSERVDYQLQMRVVENEYLSAISVHGGYFSNDDVIDFIIQCASTGRDDSGKTGFTSL